jgi:hypothetical protein
MHYNYNVIKRREVIKMNFTELFKLANELTKRNIPFELRAMMGGFQVWVNGGEWDAICHEGSYGHELGLLEIMGSIVEADDDDVEGFLTADEILARI